MPTLAELKAENAAEEKEIEAAKPVEDDAPDPLLLEAQGIKPETKEDPAKEAEGDDTVEGGDDTVAGESDDWMKSEEDAKEAKYTDHDAAAIRKKWKGRATAAEDEAEKLRKENEELKQKLKTPVVAQTIPGEPKRDDYKTDDEWIKALTAHQLTITQNEIQSQQAAAEQRRKQDEAAAATAKAVDGHYERAVKLAEKSGIKPEAYQSADLVVRKAIESQFPKAGDAVADALIASLGAGSEKVFYHLGVNATKRAQLVQLLADDKSGIRAATYLGRLNAELSAPVKRETRAPDPIDDVKGDKSGGTGIDKFKKDYKAAHEKGDGQAAFNIKRKAKAAGIDTSKWV